MVGERKRLETDRKSQKHRQVPDAEKIGNKEEERKAEKGRARATQTDRRTFMHTNTQKET